MLLKFRVQNFKSFGNPQEFSTIPAKYSKSRDHVFEAKKYKALKFSAVFGGNASGKSNFVEAIRFMQHLTLSGEVPLLAYDYKFRLKDLGKTSLFEIEVGVDEEILIYGVAVDIAAHKVSREYLYTNNGINDRLIFNMEQNSLETIELIGLAKERVKIYFKDLKRGQLLLRKLADAKNAGDSLIFSVAKKLYGWLSEELIIISPYSRFLNRYTQFTYKKTDKFKLNVIDILKTFDTGITNYRYETMKIEEFLELIKKHKAQESDDKPSLEEAIATLEENVQLEVRIKGSVYRVRINQKSKEKIVDRLSFIHCDDEKFLFEYEEESDGTKRLIELVNILHSSQAFGKTYIVDEIERSFHPNLTVEFLRKFFEYSSDNKAQLIIATHETNLMDFNMVRQDEIWLLDRDKTGMSNFVPLSDFNLRSDKARLDKDYLEGRYGGIPNILKILEGKADE